MLLKVFNNMGYTQHLIKYHENILVIFIHVLVIFFKCCKKNTLCCSDCNNEICDLLCHLGKLIVLRLIYDIR